MRLLRLSILAAALCALNGCAAKPVYYWGHYDELVYEMYANPGKADPGTQVTVLTEDIDKAHAQGMRVPPGVHAHLAYMYYQLGNQGSAEKELQAEKTLFPESTTFVDGMLQRLKKQ
jgi:hypothetical protein